MINLTVSSIKEGQLVKSQMIATITNLIIDGGADFRAALMDALIIYEQTVVDGCSCDLP